MHTRNRCGRSGQRTHSRGFTVVELGIAVLIFSIIAGIITLAVARAQISAGSDRFRRGAETELASLLAVVGTGPFNAIVDGTFTRPDACEQAIHRSCPLVIGRTLTVDWTVSGVEDLAALSSENPSGVVLEASSTLPDGKTVSLQRFVSAPNAGRDGTALVRVRLAGETYDGPLYLIGADGTVVGSTIVTAMTGLIRASIAACTSAEPCRIAMRPDGHLISGELGLDWSAIAGDGIVLAAGVITETSMRVQTPQEVQVLLLAENSSGRRAWASAPGSVCLYLNVTINGSTVSEPGCNTEAADRIVWRSFRPNPGLDVVAALPHAAMAVSTDPATGACLAEGQLGWESGWASAAVCTSWTWGPVAELRDGLTGTEDTLVDNTFTLAGSSSRYLTAVWMTDALGGWGIPAAGYDGDPLWSKPRDVPACAQTETCVPVTSGPEASCPGLYCRSNAAVAPAISSPLLGAFNIVGVQAEADVDTEFVVTFQDPDGDAITVTVENTPANLRVCNSVLSCGQANDLAVQDVLVTQAAGPVSVTLTLQAGTDFSGDQLVVSVSDGVSTRLETIELFEPSQTPVVRELWPAPVVVRQNDSTVTRMLAIGNDGQGMASVTLGSSLPIGVTLGTPVAGDSGQYSVTLSTGAIESGNATYTLSADGAAGSAPIRILAAPGGLTISAGTLAQGESTTIDATLIDAVGDPLVDHDVWFRLSSGTSGTVPLGTYPEQRGCTTDAAGLCTLTIVSEASAVPGTFTLTGYSGSISTSDTVTVTSSISRIESDGAVAEQGESVVVNIIAYDGRNEPAAGVAFSTSTNVVGVTVTGSGTTDGSGRAALTIQTGTNTPAGVAVITVNDGAVSHAVRVRVTSTVASVDVTGVTTLAQGGTVTLTLTGRNPQGAAVGLSTLSFVAPTGIALPSSVMTDSDGNAQLAISAAATRALGAGSVSVRYDGVEIATIGLTVVAGVSSLMFEGDVLRNDQSTVRLILTASDGAAVKGRSVALSSADSRITIAPLTAVTGLLGSSSHTITVGGVPPGLYIIMVAVDGRNLAVSVVVQ